MTNISMNLVRRDLHTGCILITGLPYSAASSKAPPTLVLVADHVIYVSTHGPEII